MEPELVEIETDGLELLRREGWFIAVVHRGFSTFQIGEAVQTVEEAFALCDTQPEPEGKKDIYNYLGMPMPHPWSRGA